MKNKKWFTLVELIVVITILAILGTIAFVSFGSYSSSARDSTRISDLSNISKWIEIFYTTNWNTPIPDNYVTIYLSWNIIWYQWEVWDKVLNVIKMSQTKDPFDWNKYTYYSSVSKWWQVLWFLENNPISYINGKIYADNSSRIPLTKWRALWILLNRNSSKTPINNELTWDIYTDSWTTIREKYISYNLWSSSNWIVCPNWFIEIPWNPLYSQKPFCVMKYEAKIKWQDDWLFLFNNSLDSNLFNNALPESRATWTPWTQIKQTDAVLKCKALWSKYDLISNNQWMSIAWNIESNPKNWSSWIIWDWFIYSWNNNESWNWILLSWSTNDNDWYFWTNDSNVSNPNQKRTLELTNWNVLWDFAGNVWELTNNIIETSKVPNSTNWIDDIREYSSIPSTSYALIDYNTTYTNEINSGILSPSWYNSNNWIGWYYYPRNWQTAWTSISCLTYIENNCIGQIWNISVYTRWWSIWSNYISWIYASHFEFSPSAHNKNLGFRCVYNP